MRRPGIELSEMLVLWFRGQWLEVITPGPIETSWQRWILPLNHRRALYTNFPVKLYIALVHALLFPSPCLLRTSGRLYSPLGVALLVPCCTSS
jgi:hypothetical protein